MNLSKSKCSGKSPTLLEGIYGIYPNLTMKNQKITTMKLVGFGNIRVSTDYAQKSPRTLNGGVTHVESKSQL